MFKKRMKERKKVSLGLFSIIASLLQQEQKARTAYCQKEMCDCVMAETFHIVELCCKNKRIF